MKFTLRSLTAAILAAGLATSPAFAAAKRLPNTSKERTKAVESSSAVATTIPTDNKEIPSDGQLGENITYHLDNSGILTIKGTGDMNSDYLIAEALGPFYSSLVSTVIVEKGVTSLCDYAFAGCANLSTVILPDTVDSIGSYAFKGCFLGSMTIPDSVLEIKPYAFSGSGLTSIALPTHLDEIGEGWFYSCTKLTGVLFPPSVTAIGKGAFYGCTSLTSLPIPSSILEIGDHAFAESALEEISIPANIRSIGAYAFVNCSYLNEVVFDDNGFLEEIGEGAFANCVELRALMLPESIVKLGMGAFSGCTGLSNITLPAALESIGDGAFVGCDLFRVDVESETVALGKDVFGSNDGLVLHGYDDSTAEEYARVNHISFVPYELPITALTLSEKEKTMGRGEKATLTVTVEPVRNNDGIVWESEDPDIAVVNDNGEVTAISGGMTFITATSGSGVSDSCKLIVDVPLENIILSKNNIVMEKGDKYPIDVKFVPSDTTSQREILWSVSNSSVATVKDGMITGVGRGSTIVTAEVDGITASCIVAVNATSTTTAITLDATKKNIKPGETAELKATLTPADAKDEIIWSSSNPAIATVENGKVTGVSSGIVSITAAAGGRITACTVKVEDNRSEQKTASIVYADASKNSVSLLWTAASSANGYEIHRADNNSSNFVKIGEVDGKTTKYTDTSVQSGKTYSYQVRPYTSGWKDRTYGEWSNSVMARTGSNPLSLEAESAGTDSVRLTWKTVSNANGYDIFCSKDKGATYQFVSTVNGARITSFTDFGLQPGETVSYRVIPFASSRNGNIYLAASAVKDVQPIPAAPANFSGRRSGTEVTLRWSPVDGAEGYGIYRAAGDGHYSRIATVEATTYKDTIAATDTICKYQILAYCTSGKDTVYGAWSQEVTIQKGR